MIWIVMPILIVLMFLLGTDLNKKSFTDVARNPRAVIIGMIGQLILLPLIAFALAYILNLPPVYFMGIVLIACCPGGSSSNVFSMLAKGDVALSVTLTAGSGVTINSQAAYKMGYLLFVIARITLSSNVSAYATLLTHGLNTRCGWVAPLYTQTSQNFSVYGDAGDTTIRTKQTITAGTYQISCVIPWY